MTLNAQNTTASIPGLTLEQREALDKYLDLLLEANTRLNLTSITSREDAQIKHIDDSLTAAKYLPCGASVLDIGSGGGCPAIPLKIIRNDVRLTMTDGVNKKVNFLKEAIVALGLTDTCALSARAETLAATDFRESFDVVTARAVASLRILLELAIPLLKVGGLFIAYKSDADEELAASANAMRLLGCKLYKKDAFVLDGKYNRTLYIFQKISLTDSKYPRSYAKIKQREL